MLEFALTDYNEILINLKEKTDLQYEWEILLWFQALSCAGVYISILVQSHLAKNLTSMAGRVGSKPKLVVANYFTSSSEDENEKEKGEVIDLQLPDFEPFYASYRRYRKELSHEELKQLINNGLINIRENPLIIEVIRKMFDFDLEVGEIERDVFNVKDKLELIFNFMYISFQLMDGPMDINIANLLKRMNEKILR